MKKTLKVLSVSFVSLIVILAVATVIAVKVFLPEDKIKSYITDYAKNNLNREVSFDKLSFALIGINLENFKMSERSTFKEGTFIKADKFSVKISPLPLLSKEIKISNILLNDLDVNITKDKDGKFNFDDIIESFNSSEEKSSEKPTSSADTAENKKENVSANNKDTEKENSFSVNINDLTVKDADIHYTDVADNLSASIKNFNLSIKDFSFTELFSCETSCDIDFTQNKLHAALPISAKFKTYLANFDMEKILLNIENLETIYNKATFALNGTVKNINNPKVECNIIVKNINEKTFKDFFDLNQKFGIDEIDFKTKTVVNLSSANANIESLSLVMPNSSSNLSGTVDWGKTDLQYNLKLATDLLIDDFAKFVPEYNLKGKLKTDIKATQNIIDGTFNLENVSSESEFGTIENLNLNSSIKVQNKTALQNIDFEKFNIDSFVLNIGKFAAKYNDMTFSLNGKFENTSSSALTLNAQAKNITNATIKNFYECPVKFIVPTLDLNSVLTFNLKNNTANITKFNIKIPDSSASVLGKLNWNNKKNFVYNLTLNLNLLLDNFAKSFPEYNMKGRIKSDAKVSNKDFSGTLSLSNIAFDYLPMAQISKLNLEASAKSKNSITLKTASGIFNKGNFKADGSFINNDIKFNFNMDKLTVKTSTASASSSSSADTAPNGQSTQQNTQSASSQTTTAQSKATSNAYNIYTNININEINVPYLTSKNAALKTSLKSVTEDMKKADGTFSLVISTGTIKDLYKFSDNKYVKLFLLLFNALNNNASANKNNANGIQYDNMTANVTFTKGLMKTDKVAIKIPLTTMDVTGTADFKTEKLDLKVNTGLYAAMKITGTLSDPKTSFDVVSTATEILNNSQVKDVLEDAGKKLSDSLKKLFK